MREKLKGDKLKGEKLKGESTPLQNLAIISQSSSFPRIESRPKTSKKSFDFESILDMRAKNPMGVSAENRPAKFANSGAEERTLLWTTGSDTSSAHDVDSPRSGSTDLSEGRDVVGVTEMDLAGVIADLTGVIVDLAGSVAMELAGSVAMDLIGLFLFDTSSGGNSAIEKEELMAGNSLLHLRGSPFQFRSPSPQIEEILDDNSPVHPDNQHLPISPPTTFGIERVLDSIFFSHFANRFLPTIAQPHFHHSLPRKDLVLSAAAHSEMLREIFVACGASLVAFDNELYRAVAQQKYKLALLNFFGKIKHGVEGSEDWYFVAVQVLQTLSLRDAFGGANATRCAAHFSAAYKIMVRLLNRPQVPEGEPQYSPLEKVLIENFIFNYSITIFYCDHKKLTRMVPNPFDFFSIANTKLAQMSYEDGSPQSSRMSMLSFQIAAKCSWLCRLKLPFDEAEQRLHFEMLLFAETILFSLESVDFSLQHVLVQNTVSVAKVVLLASIILLRKMLDMEGVRAHHLQELVIKMVSNIGKPYNQDIIFPIWSLMIGSSTALDNRHRGFFMRSLEKLVDISKSKIAMQVLNHLEGLWEIYEADEPFELLFDTEVLDQVCI